MKKIIQIIVLIFVVNQLGFAQEKECVRKTNFGEAEICFPKIEGYQECYLDPLVKQIADATEVETNEVLGFYLNDKIYQKKDSTEIERFDDYFKIYGTKQIKDYPADKMILQEMQKLLAGNFISKNWDLMEKEVDKIGLEVKIGIPTIINSYNLNENSFTFIALTKYETEDTESFTVAISINGMILNERLIWMAYYLDYSNEESISRLEKQSNKILSELMFTDQ